MVDQEGATNGSVETTAEDNLKLVKQLAEMNSDECHPKENGVFDPYDSCPNSTHDQLVQMIIELKFQNEYFKSQIKDLQMQYIGTESTGSSQQYQKPELDNISLGDVKALQEKIELLNRELLEEKQTCNAAEVALSHLRESYSEADARAQVLSAKLAEAQQKMEKEIKERDDKYSELDSKFSRLHKRAKQRIQDVQKEKDDLEAQFRDANEKAERASSQLSALQLELERSRKQANEALKAMDAERQQLRSVNNKLRDNIEELRHSLEPKEHALEALQQSLLEKEQMLDNMRGLLQATEEKRQASVAEITSKHQKHVESLEMQLAEAVSESNKAAETVSSLQVLVAEKESKIAEMDAAKSGESARLKAAIESLKGDFVHQKQEHEKERESWEATCKVFKAKLETAESSRVRAEIEAAKIRSQLELQLSEQAQLINDKDSELAASREQISRLAAEFSSYKLRAHSLLQKKDADLAAAKDSEQIKALEEALKEAENEISLVSIERDKAVNELQAALANYDKELSARDAALRNSDQKIKNLEAKLDSHTVKYQSEKDALELKLRDLEEMWHGKYEALKAEKEASVAPDMQTEIEELKLQCSKLKEEHDSFHDLADRMLEDKDKEISRLLYDNNKLQRALDSELKGGDDDTRSRASQKQDTSSTSTAEQQILMLARQQAQREEELAQSQRHILALQEELEELERENRLHNQQVSMLKEELRSMDRSRKREGVDMTYLKNVVLKLLETGEVEALLPVIAMLLQFSPDEVQKCQQVYRSYADASASSENEASSRSLFSRFSFV
ncbi:protein GRIP [Amaranthus tricolor]|uniref:protein GRIP n=1 Tax=Amaranthus tricolor TaxID=29722 RepID=UPI0025841C5D|nr:protein GRIP [Amaranthus tricolor]